MSRTSEPGSVHQRLRALGLYGLAVPDDALHAQPWIEQVIDIEDRERKRRFLERRLTNARIRCRNPSCLQPTANQGYNPLVAIRIALAGHAVDNLPG